MAGVLTPFLSTNWLDLRVLNIEAFKRESVSTMLNAVNIYAPSVKIRLYFYFSAPREGKKGKKGERRVEGRARNPRQYPVLAKRIAISAVAVLINFADFQAAKSTLTAMQRRGLRLSTSKRTEYPYFRFIILRYHLTIL